MTAEIEKLIARAELNANPLFWEYASALRAMQAERDIWRADSATAWDTCEKRRLAQCQAEAKLAEVEKERDGLLTTWAESRERHLAAEATVATLTAQVEAMRGALEQIAGSDIQSFMIDARVGPHTVSHNRRYCDAPDVARLLKIARAALTTEKTNG